MPQNKKAPLWSPPSKRTSYQDAKKRPGGKTFSEGAEDQTVLHVTMARPAMTVQHVMTVLLVTMARPQ